MANDDLEIRLVRPERQITLIIRLVIPVFQYPLRYWFNADGADHGLIGAMAASEHRQI